MTDDELPEADAAPGAPHPRHTDHLFGQSHAEAEFLDAFNSGRLHHGWLITGPKGVGKATLAWRIARFLLTKPLAQENGLFGETPAAADTLDTDPDHPITRRMSSLAEPSLFLLRTAWDQDKKKFKQGISVEEARKLKGFFQLSSADGGRRVVIVDAADDLNVGAANALLKLLEEPPQNAVLLLICHQPARLLPTIRSRCRELRCMPLGPEDLSAAMGELGQSDASPSLAALAAGSVGQAVRLHELGGLDTYQGLLSLFESMPNLDRSKTGTIADSFGARSKDDAFSMFIDLIDILLSRLARTGIAGTPQPAITSTEERILHRLSPDARAARIWAEVQQEIGSRARQGRAVNLDPSALILDMILRINEYAAKTAA